MIESLENLRACSLDGQCVMITLVTFTGSTPREPGSKLVVSEHEVAGALGGERLEAGLVVHARALLAAARPEDSRAELVRGFTGGCGGVADVLFELLPASLPPWVEALEAAARDSVSAVLATVVGDGRKLLISAYPASAEAGDEFVAAVVERGRAMLAEGRREPLILALDEPPGAPMVVLEPLAGPPFDVVVFGAGRVARPLIDVLGQVRCRVAWVTAPGDAVATGVPANVIVTATDAPVQAVDEAPPGASFLVMTMAHDLDYLLTRRILECDRFGFLGVIGSKTKRETFERRLRIRGFGAESLARITCRIGIEGIRDKDPGAIAIAVAAQLLQVRANTLARAAVQ